MPKTPEPVTLFLSYAHEDEELLNRLVVHLSGLKRQGVIKTWYDRQMMTPEAAFLLNVAGYYLDDRARYEDAEALYVRALSMREQVLGEEHADTATSLNNLAEMYRKQGKHLEAEPLCVRALVICEHVLGREHPSTRLVRRNYVGLLRKMGRNKDAKRVEGS